jgi:hypothetical protein
MTRYYCEICEHSNSSYPKWITFQDEAGIYPYRVIGESWRVWEQRPNGSVRFYKNREGPEMKVDMKEFFIVKMKCVFYPNN